MRFHITAHQALRLAERQLSLEVVKQVVQQPEEMELLSRGQHRGSLKKFKRAVGNRRLVVVAETKREECWLATAYYED